jgi:lipopolysaccharide biosynthesis regulator YciM
MQELLWLLLPVAAASGWMAARRSRKQNKRPCFDVSSDYFKGLNYLLNEQPDKAIEVFVRMAEVDNDTAETHLALGSLFRRRGEVDRAILIHQNLIARPSLSLEQRAHALSELGEDYMKAGLLDRAEHLFQELIELKSMVPSALKHLIDIYQQEQDWEKTIEICHQYDRETGSNSGEVVAQYYCELAEKSLEAADKEQFSRYIKQAFKHEKNCVRASMLLADKEMHEGNYDRAISCFQQIVNQDIDYFPNVIESLKECFIKTGKEKELSPFLDSILEHYGGITPVLYRAEEILSDDEGQAIAFMVEQLRHKPSVRGLQWLVELILDRSEGKARENLTILRDLMDTLMENKPVYECQHCGFNGKSMHWQCPGCKQWNTIKPIKGVVAE